MAIEIINCTASVIVALTALAALIFSFIHFNKRLGFYCYRDQNILKIRVFNKGNKDCGIFSITYYVEKLNPTIIRENIGDDFSIDLSNFAKSQRLRILIVDSYGRRYSKQIKV